MSSDNREKPRILQGPDGKYTAINPLEHSFPKLNIKELALKIKLFLKSVSNATDGKVLGFRSKIEFDKDGLIKIGQNEHSNVFSLFGIKLRFLSDIETLFDRLGDGQNFSTSYVKTSENPHVIICTIAKRRGVTESHIRDAKDGDAILNEAFRKKKVK